jgi:hypothetical protein
VSALGGTRTPKLLIHSKASTVAGRPRPFLNAGQMPTGSRRNPPRVLRLLSWLLYRLRAWTGGPSASATTGIISLEPYRLRLAAVLILPPGVPCLAPTGMVQTSRVAELWPGARLSLAHKAPQSGRSSV